MEFKIEDADVYGFEFAIVASGNPMRAELSDDFYMTTEADLKRANRLGSVQTGTGHDNFLKGILVQMNVTAPLYWWKQAQRYHWFDFISSQSTMHSLLKFDVGSQCTSDVDPQIISIIENKIKNYKYAIANKDKFPEYDAPTIWRGIIASLPSGFCLSASMTTNYQQLKTMYFQRKDHKLKEWHLFCEWCEQLPHFKELLGIQDKVVV